MIRTLAAVAFALAVSTGRAQLNPGQPGADGSPEQIHLSYTNDPTSMVVTYATMSASRRLQGESFGSNAAPNGLVKWGVASGSYPSSAVSTASTYSTGGTPWPGFIYKATMTGLKPATRYYYVVTVGSAVSDECA